MDCERVKEVIIAVDKRTIADFKPFNDPAHEMAGEVYSFIVKEDKYIADNYEFKQLDTGLYFLSVNTVEYKEKSESKGVTKMNNNNTVNNTNNNNKVKGDAIMNRIDSLLEQIKGLNDELYIASIQAIQSGAPIQDIIEDLEDGIAIANGEYDVNPEDCYTLEEVTKMLNLDGSVIKGETKINNNTTTTNKVNNIASKGEMNMNNNTENNTNNNKIKGTNTMIKTTGFNRTMEALNRKEVKEVTKANFMDRMNRDYGHSIQADENLGVGQITIASNVFSAISLMNDEMFKPIALRALTEVLGKMPGFNQGFGEYHGLFVEEIVADDIVMDYVTVSKEQEDAIIVEMISCDLNDVKNLRKIFSDINDLFRMYQELTIDAAKKLYVIVATFYNEIMRANSTIHLNHNFVSFKDTNEFAIYRGSKYAAPKDAELGQMVEFKNAKGKVTKVAFKDTVSEIQDTIADQYAELVNTHFKEKYKDVKLSDEIVASFGLGTEFEKIAADLYEAIRKEYSKVTAWKVEETKKADKMLYEMECSNFAYSQRIQKIDSIYEQELSRLSNLARWYTQDLDMATAGKLMFMISNIKRVGKDWLIDEESTNQMFLAIAPELFVAYVVAEHAEMDICGYKLLGNTAAVTEGQVLTFVNGNAQEVENVYVDSMYYGQLTVQMVNDVLCVVKKIEIPRIEATTPEYITVSLMEYSTIDAVHFATKKELVKTGHFSTLISQKVFEKAEKIQVVPFFTYKNTKGQTKYYHNALVCTIPSLNDPNVKFEIPVGTYYCNSALFESKIAGVTVSNVKIDIDGQTMRVKMEYGNIEEVKLNKAKEVNNTINSDAINDNPFASSVKVTNVVESKDDPLAVIDKSVSMVTNSSDEAEAFGASGAIADDFTDNDFSNLNSYDEYFNDFDDSYLSQDDKYESSSIGDFAL